MSEPAAAESLAPERTENTPRGTLGSWFARVAWAVMALGCWLLLTLSARLHPDPRGFGTHTQLGLAPCGFTAMTGIPCPGCGLTTSFANMAHGHWVRAFVAHPMGPFLFLMVVGVGVYAPWAIAKRRPLSVVLDSNVSFAWLVVTATAGVATFVLRVMHVIRVPG